MRNIKTFESFANEAKEDLTGKFVELKGDEGIWYEVESDNGNRVEVVAVGTNLKFPPREVVNKKFILQIKDSIDESVNEAKYNYINELIELLSDVDAMEMMPAEFEDHLSTELDIDGKKAMDIFDAYWSLGAKDRFHFTEKDWVKFLKKQGIK